MLFHTVLAVKVRDAGATVGAGHRCVDQVADPGGPGGVRDRQPLLDLILEPDDVRGPHREDGVHPGRRGSQ